MYFSDSSVKEILDSKIDFQEHWNSLLKKVDKTAALLCKSQNILQSPALLTIYEWCVRAHLISSLKYHASLAITGAIGGTSRDKKVSRKVKARNSFFI